jgi:ubiquinone/menaquinone biosynthesis C-methylase UbiE
VIDVGGGPGVYSAWLAAQGYRVELVDPVPLHVEEARRLSNAGASFDVHLGDARQLPFGDAIADAMLLMGPIYHLVERTDRDLALAEARRVLRPGGVLIAAAIGRFAWLCDAVARDLTRERRVVDSVVASVETGMSTQDPRPQAFHAYFHRPDELRDEITTAQFESVEIVAVEGIGHLLHDVNQRLADPSSAEPLLELLHHFEGDPALLGISSHLMAIARSCAAPPQRMGGFAAGTR